MEQMHKVANCAVLCSSRQVQPLFKTVAGELFLGKCEEVLKARKKQLAGKVQLIFTSPPFPLKRKKRYGNFTGSAYIEWLSKLAPTFAELLTNDGSIVLELGNDRPESKFLRFIQASLQ
jgi:hypothetical protein